MMKKGFGETKICDYEMIRKKKNSLAMLHAVHITSQENGMKKLWWLELNERKRYKSAREHRGVIIMKRYNKIQLELSMEVPRWQLNPPPI